VRYVYLMHASTARSLKRDGRDHSSSMKQPAVVPSALARGSQPAAVSNALTYLQHSATSPRASIFTSTKHGVCCNFLEAIGIHSEP